jgi:hypothetical protein
MSRTALVLAGHGSHISAETAGVVWRYVDRLREMGVADEVTAAFWKEMPSFHTVLDMLEAADITIVSMFTAQGYFTETVIPVEMGLSGETPKAARQQKRKPPISANSESFVKLSLFFWMMCRTFRVFTGSHPRRSLSLCRIFWRQGRIPRWMCHASLGCPMV